MKKLIIYIIICALLCPTFIAYGADPSEEGVPLGGTIPAPFLAKHYDPARFESTLNEESEQLQFVLLCTFDLMLSLPDVFAQDELSSQNIYSSAYTFGLTETKSPCLMFISNAAKELIIAQYIADTQQINVGIIPVSTDAPITEYALELSKQEGTDYFMGVNMDTLMEYYTLFIKANKEAQQAP